MNRMKEYQELMQELESMVPELDDTLMRAGKRKKKNQVYRTICSMTIIMLMFVGTVNYSKPAANACSKIPFLKELAEAVTFSKSLKDAVENEYMQKMELIETKNNVTAKVEYLIVDQKQVTVFYRLESDIYNEMRGTPEVAMADGSAPPPCSYWTNNGDLPSGELHSFTIDFEHNNVPDSLKIQLSISGDSMEVIAEEEEVGDGDIYVAVFEFLLTFDPLFTASGKEIDVDQKVVLDGQKITITKISIYPSHIRIEVADDVENTAWLKGLEFQIIVDGEEVFEPVSNGVSATGAEGTPAMASFRADSSYFYEAEQIELSITGAQWLDKASERAYINLVSGETEGLPEEVEFYDAKKAGKDWIVQLRVPFREKDHFYQVLSMEYYDSEGNVYEIKSRSTCGDYEGDEATHFIEEVPLANYDDDEVWVSPLYSRVWKAEKPVVVGIEIDESDRKTGGE